MCTCALTLWCIAVGRMWLGCILLWRVSKPKRSPTLYKPYLKNGLYISSCCFSTQQVGLSGACTEAVSQSLYPVKNTESLNITMATHVLKCSNFFEKWLKHQLMKGYLYTGNEHYFQLLYFARQRWMQTHMLKQGGFINTLHFSLLNIAVFL